MQGVKLEVEINQGKPFPVDQQKGLEFKQFLMKNEGMKVIMEIRPPEEADYSKALPMYYRQVVIPAIFERFKEKYTVSSHLEVDDILSAMFCTIDVKSTAGESFKIATRIESLSYTDQAIYVGKVAEYAIKALNIKLPSAKTVSQ